MPASGSLALRRYPMSEWAEVVFYTREAIVGSVLIWVVGDVTKAVIAARLALKLREARR
jgi:biotin transporter BioY